MRKMKDSGIEWIGQIPQEWEISRVKYLYDVTLGKMLQPAPKSDDDELCSYICAANINWSGVDLSVEKKMWFSAKDKESYRLAAGDLLVTEGGDVAVSCIWNDELSECYIQNAVHRVRPKSDASNRYLYYWLSTLKATGYIDLVCNKATLAHFTKDKFDSCVIPVVSADEQHTIANYLDAKCAEIDALIAAKEKTNALLKEQRQSIIYEAVTKGLDPNVPMKDSGIEWIGEIPEGWNTVKLSYLFKTIGSGTTPESSNCEFYDGEYPWLQTGDLNDGIVTETSKSITRAAVDCYSALNLYKKGTIIVAMYGATIGKLGILDIDCYTNQACCAMAEPMETDSKFIYYWLRGNKDNIVRLSLGGGQPNISQGIIAALKVSLPREINEQQKISKYLDSKCAEIDTAIATNNETIQKLKEYRQSVIYEAVTGKIEV